MTPKFIRSAHDLVTSVKATQNGFLTQALRKTKEAAPYVAAARELQRILLKTPAAVDLAHVDSVRDTLLTSCGFSDKSLRYFNGEERRATLQKVLTVITDQASDTWRDEILYRFLLTSGDSLGGSMRNIVGAEANIIFTRALREAIETKSINGLQAKSNRSGKIQGLAWPNRALFFDRSPVFLPETKTQQKNIDAILVTTGIARPTDSLWGLEDDFLRDPNRYVACGELKGGIDPAGADEHWKTAASALDRIRKRFPRNTPKLFFVAAAIAKAMAVEIFDQLRDGRLTHAANLTVPQQLADLADWLTAL